MNKDVKGLYLYILGPQKPNVKQIAINISLPAALFGTIYHSSYPHVPYPNKYGLTSSEIADLILNYTKL